MSTYQSLWLAASTVLAFCGAIAAAMLSSLGGGAIGLGVVLGAMVGWIYAAVQTRSGLSRTHWRGACVAGVMVCGLVVAVTGLTLLLGGWGFVLVVVLVVGSPPSIRWADRTIFRRLEGGSVVACATGMVLGQSGEPPMAGSATLAPSIQTVLPDCSSLTDEELCRRWRHSILLLSNADVATWRRVVQLRGCYLDELERRNSAGFARWLGSGARAAGDPSRFLVDHGPGGLGSQE